MGKDLKEVGEVRPFPRPWYIDLKYAVIRAVGSLNPNHRVASILEEIEMPPFFLFGVVNLHTFPTSGTRKNTSSGKIDKNLEDSRAFMKLYLRNLPWRFQLQRSRKQFLQNFHQKDLLFFVTVYLTHSV